MHKLKIRLDTTTDAMKFHAKIENIPGKITVTDNAGLCINAKSVLGMLYCLEFAELWCESEKDIYSIIEEFVE